MSNAATNLAIVPTKETALEVFRQDRGLDPYLAKIREEIDGFVPDVSTRKGRDAIASIAYKVAQSKTALDTVGKELVAELKAVPAKIDAERKRMRDLLDGWRDEVRKPLTEWEQAETDRVYAHEQRLASLRNTNTEGMTASVIGATIQDLDSTVIDDAWQEFEAEAHRVKAASLATLRDALAKREQYEAEQAELVELRRKQAEQEQKDREERIAREAAEKAQREADQRAQAEREAVAKREADAKAQAEKRELELTLAAERAEREKLEAQQREEQATQRAAAQAEAAAKAERQRIADEQASAEREAKAREADKAHRRAINRAALDAFIAGGMPEACAKQAIELIAKGEIPSITIRY